MTKRCSKCNKSKHRVILCSGCYGPERDELERLKERVAELEGKLRHSVFLESCGAHTPTTSCGACGHEPHDFVPPNPMGRATGCDICGFIEEKHQP